MKVLMINSVCGIRSTGRICTDLAEEFEKNGDTVKIAYGRETVPEKYEHYAVRIGNDNDVRIAALESRILDNAGFGNVISTKKFLKWAAVYDPDLLWLHNIHGYYINVELLFEWIKSRPNMKVRWTLHDCWAFTGHCAYFTYVKCYKWREHCFQCEQKKAYPSSLVVDHSTNNFYKKRDVFTGVQNMTLITPSYWLKGLIEQSYLSCYQVEVHHNTVDTNIFKPTPSDFREKYHLESKKVILGVASIWEKRKGLDDLIELSHHLKDDQVIVIVGVSEDQKSKLGSNMIGITRTNDAKELAGLYTTSDVLINPTYEDNYPTVNIEAKACGLPVITYNVGGSPESVPKENVIETGNIEKLVQRMNEILEK